MNRCDTEDGLHSCNNNEKNGVRLFLKTWPSTPLPLLVVRLLLMTALADLLIGDSALLLYFSESGQGVESLL